MMITTKNIDLFRQLRIQYQMLSDMIEYFQGDGESLPDTPPNETTAAADPALKIANKASHPFSLDIKVLSFVSDIMNMIVNKASHTFSLDIKVQIQYHIQHHSA